MQNDIPQGFRYNSATMATPLTEQLDNLNVTKGHVISESAKDAKSQVNTHAFETLSSDYNQNLSDIDLFNDNVKALTAVLKHTRFDEFMVLIGQPQRFVMLSFISGLTRGLGFALGVLIIIGITLTFGGTSILEWLQR